MRKSCRGPNEGGDEMARFVVAGKVDCAENARAEILADQLKTYLPDFHVHKVYTHLCSMAYPDPSVT